MDVKASIPFLCFAVLAAGAFPARGQGGAPAASPRRARALTKVGTQALALTERRFGMSREVRDSGAFGAGQGSFDVSRGQPDLREQRQRGRDLTMGGDTFFEDRLRLGQRLVVHRDERTGERRG